MLLNLVLLVSGFALLIKGADYLVDGASDIARRFRVSSLVIGLTIVAFGTSAPELAVNVLSAVSGNTDIALGNINGSNIANILLVLGVTGIFARIPVKSRTIVKEIPFMILAGSVLVFVMLDSALEGTAENMISRIDGIMFLSFFLIFLYYMYLSARDITSAKIERSKRSFFIAFVMTFMGLIGLVLGGQLTVLGATNVALGLGVSQTLIAISVVAIGTSLPELITSIVAARKGDTDMAIGNVVGSNIFNILFVLGTTAVIAPINASKEHITDSIVALGAMLILLIVVHFGGGFLKKDISKDVSRKEGAFMILLYLTYIIYVVLRG